MLSVKYGRALVTGGAGLVGSNLVEDLLDTGVEVVSFDDMSAGNPRNLDRVRDNPRLTEVVGDVTDKEAVAGAMRDVDIVFHQAVSKNTICMTNPNRDLEVNAGGTLNLLLEAVNCGVKKFVHASTGSVYGRTETFPTTEEAPVAPVSYYGVSKLAAERYVHAFHTLHELDVTILRYYHVFGPGQDDSDVGGVVPIFVRRALQQLPLKIFGDGSQLRAFTFVKDVTQMNIAAALRPQSNGQVYNCASDERITIAELGETILRLLGREPDEIEYHDWKPGDIKHFDISNAKIKNQLEFEYRYSFEEGLDQTIDFVRSGL
jgi:UDP-glucose 4-epimerase